MALALRRLAFTTSLVVVLVLMLRPAQEVSSSNDKVDHLVVFGVLAVLGLWAGLAVAWLGLGLSAYAVLTEVLQATVTTSRHGDPRDVVADIAGVAVVVAIALGLRRARRASTGRDRRPA